MSLVNRIARIEKALAAELVGALGIRNFVTVDGGLTYVETTPPQANRTAMGAAPFDFELALVGCGGTLPDDMPRLTDADLDRFTAEGWQCIAICYGEMHDQAAMPEPDEPDNS